jgi:Family of unknown function (DUF6261)
MFALSIVSPADKVEAAKRVYDIVIKKYAGDAVVEKLGGILGENIEQTTKSLGSKTVNEITKKLRAIDELRDQGFRALISMLKAHKYYTPHPHLVVVIDRLFEKLIPHGLSFLSGPDLAETSKLNEKLNVIESEEFEELNETIGTKLFIDNVKTLNEKFREIYEDRIEEKDETPLALHKVIPGLNQSIEALYTYLKLTDKENLKTVFTPIINVYTEAQKRKTQKDNG